MIRCSTYVVPLVFALGCAAPPGDSDPQSLRAAIERGAIDVDGLDEISDVELRAVEQSFDAFATEGLLGDGSAVAGTLGRKATCGADDRGKLLRVELAALWSKAAIDRKWDAWYQGLSVVGFVAQTTEDLDPYNFAHVWRVEYCTVDFDGSPIAGSGVVAVPGAGLGQPVDMTLYGHGTSLYRFDTPSVFDPDVSYDGMTPMLALVAGYGASNTRGDIVVVPDYTGFYTSEAPRHRYLDAYSEAASMVDIYRAARRALPTFTVRYSGSLNVTGFSQGGHVALAATRALQEDGTAVNATITTGGVYVVEDPMNNYLLFIEDPSVMGIIGYHAATAFDVGALPGLAVSDIFLDEAVYNIYDTSTTFEEAFTILPATLGETFTASFVADQLLAPDSDFQRWMASNNVISGWCPTSPVLDVHALDDYVVPRDFMDGWMASWSAACPGSDVAVVGDEVGEVGGVFDPHEQIWNDLLPGLGARLNAL